MNQTPPTPPQNDTPAEDAVEVSSGGTSSASAQGSAPAPSLESVSAEKKSQTKPQEPPKPAQAPAAAKPPLKPAQSSPRPEGGSPSGGRVRLWLVLLALVVAGLSLFASGLMWQRLGQTQQEMARRSQDSAAQSIEARAVAGQAEELTKELQARLTVAEVRLSEVSLQRSQLEELMLSLSRSRDDNLVQDIESALRLGQQQAQLTGSVQPLLSALQAADQRIGRAAQPRLNPVQRAIARDIERIQGAALADVPSLVLRLDELARQVDEWPVVNEVGPLSGRAKSAGQVLKTKTQGTKAGVATTGDGTTTGSTTPSARTTASVGDGTASTSATAPAPMPIDGWGMAYWSGLWSRIWNDFSRTGRDLVRVSRIDQPEAALLAPEQAFFLRENVKLKLLNARLGLLARQLSSAQADVKSVEASLGRYFDTGAPSVLAAQAALSKLRQELVVTDIPRPEESLAALTTAAGGR
jgi:uroporphyrin-III C-methyltransferase